MKKIYLFIFWLNIIALGMIAQTVSPMWSNLQNTNFSITAAATEYMDAVDQNVLWATGIDYTAPHKAYSFFTKTNDGGLTFTSGNIFPDTNTYLLSNIEGIDANNAWVAAYSKPTSDKGYLFHTTDGGTTWTNGGAAGMFTVSGSSFADFVCFVTPSIGIALGDPVAGDFQMYRTTDGGSTWATVASSILPNSMTGEYGLSNGYAKFGSTDIWFGTTKNRIYHSNNAGQTWTVCPALTSTLGAAVQITDIAFRDLNNGLAKAYFGSGTAAGLTLWKTSNGGSTWTRITPLDPNFGHLDLCAIPGTNWYASCGGITSNSVISYSTDDGVTWNNWGSSGIPYFNIDFVSNSVGWAGTVSSATNAAIGGIYKYVGQPLGMEDASNFSIKINLFPNPADKEVTAELNLENDAVIGYKISDITGRILYEEPKSSFPGGNHKIIITNNQEVKQGLYFVNFTINNHTTSHRLIIK